MAEKKVTDTKNKSSYSKKKKYKKKRKKHYKKKFYYRKKYCFFCKNDDIEIDYKNIGLMKRFISDNGKISPRRFTGTCAKHQRKLAIEIKKARKMALIPFTDKH